MRNVLLVAIFGLIAAGMGGSSRAEMTTTFAGSATHSTGTLTPCTAGAFDLSLPTGCNLPFYLGGIIP